MDRRLETERLVLKVLNQENVDMLVRFLDENREDFVKYEAEKSEIYFSRYYQEYMLKMEYEAIEQKSYLRYYLFERGNEAEIIGTVSVNQVKSFPYCSGVLGYKMAIKKKRMGYATEAVRKMCCQAKTYLKLHRLEAYVIEDNIPSIRLLEKCGFEWEGKCRENLKINGVWQDHLLYGKILE